MLIRLDPSSPEPLFIQLASAIRGAAARGELRAGERLPAARELAESLDLNVHTVLRGYQVLREQGLLDLRRGRGAVLTQQAEEGMAALYEAVAEVGARARKLGVKADELTEMIRREYA